MSSTALVRSPSAQAITQTTAGQKSASPVPVTLPALNITPQKNNTSPAKTSTPQNTNQNGWMHPRMDEIIRRRSATNFDSSNMKNILMSAACLFVTFFVPGFLYEMCVSNPYLVVHF